MIAATINSGSSPIDWLKILAFPANSPCNEIGTCRLAIVRWMALVAVPSDSLGGRLKEKVVATNGP